MAILRQPTNPAVPCNSPNSHSPDCVGRNANVSLPSLLIREVRHRRQSRIPPVCPGARPDALARGVGSLQTADSLRQDALPWPKPTWVANSGARKPATPRRYTDARREPCGVSSRRRYRRRSGVKRFPEGRGCRGFTDRFRQRRVRVAGQSEIFRGGPEFHGNCGLSD